MPSTNKRHHNSDDEPQGLHPITKAIIPILIAALVSLLGTGGGLIAKNIADIRTVNRKLERTNVDKYRRMVDHYRAHYADAKECIVRNKRFVRTLEEDHELSTAAAGRVDVCEEEKAQWSEVIENYVEENKHMGYD